MRLKAARMNKYEAFRNGLLKNASQFAGNDHLYFTSSSRLSVEFDIPEPHVREQLVELVDQGLIRMTAWEGIRECLYCEWPDADSFFFNRSDGGNIRIRLRRAGAELVSASSNTRYNHVKMLDPQKWKIAVARFTGYCANLPPFPKTEDVNDYHAIITALEQASGQDLSNFKIPAEKLKPKIVSVRPAPYRGGRGEANYSRDNYCDSNFFQSQIDALKHYLPSIEADIENGRQANKVDRNYIIAAVKQDSPVPPQQSTTFNVYDSNFNYASPGASITSNVGSFTKEEFSNLIDGLRQLLRDEKLDEAAKNEININIDTIELQLNSAQPNASILKESLKSVRTIVQNAASSLITSGVLATVNQVLAKL